MNVDGLRANRYGTAYIGQGKGRQRTDAAQKTGQFASEYAAQAAEGKVPQAAGKAPEGKAPQAAGKAAERKAPQAVGKAAGNVPQAAGKAAEGNAPHKWNVACTSTNVVLHGTDTAKGDEAVTAWANVAAGTSMTVYRPQGFDPENPVYKVKMWDESGKETECMVDISKVNPANCNVMEMYAYSAHLNSSGEYPGALERFLMVQAYQRDSVGNYSRDNLFDRTDWLKILGEVMQMQYNAGNLKGYLEYKGFLNFLVQKESEKEEGVSPAVGENQVDTDIQVNPDGSRVLVMTRRIGGMAMTTSVEISKPTELPNDAAAQTEGQTARQQTQAADAATADSP